MTDRFRARHMTQLTQQWRAERAGRRGYGSIILNRPRPTDEVGDTFEVDRSPLRKVDDREVVKRLALDVAAQAKKNPAYVQLLVDRLMERGALPGMTREQAMSSVGDVIQKYAEMAVHSTAAKAGRNW